MLKITRPLLFKRFATFDVAVIGGGPGGYVAAIKAAQLGLNTVCIEKRQSLGGTCLNVGCIPSKTLLNISHQYHEISRNLPSLGITATNVKVDWPTVQKSKSKIVGGLTSGISGLFKRNGVTLVHGVGRLVNPNLIDVVGDRPECISAKHIVIATGSVPAPFPGGSIVADEKFIVTSTGALELNKIPKKMIVIGGGVIGLELGSVYLRFGTTVEVVEFLDRIAPGLDGDAGRSLHKCLEKQGMHIKTGRKVTGAVVDQDGVTLKHGPANGSGQEETSTADVVLLCVGRIPYTDGLGLEKLGIEMDRQGRVMVDDKFKTSLSNVRAIGDCIRGPMLAHKAEEEGVAVAELIAGKGPGHVNYDAVPSVVYTHPEVAGVGKTEEELKASNVTYKKGSFPFGANSRARANVDADGLVKVLTVREKIVGAWIVGPQAGELIGELGLAIEYGASAEDVARTCHAHPTLSEAVKEACMAAYDKPIHMA